MDFVGDISIEKDGLLSFTNFCRVYLLVKKYTHISLYPQLRELISERREALLANKMDKYQQIETMRQKVEEMILGDVSEQIYDYFGISQEVFDLSWQRVSQSIDNSQKFQEL